MSRCLCFVAMIFPAVAFGQAEFGLKAGLNVSDVVMTNYIDRDVESDLTLKLGPHVGFFVNGMMHDRVGMAAELLYSNKGVKGISNIHLHYITLPLLFQYKLTDHIYAEVGPEPGYMFSARSGTGNVSNTYSNKFDLALDVGFRLDTRKCLFALRYCAGFFSVKEPLENSVFPGEKVKYQNRVLQISFGYKIWSFEQE